MQVSDPEEIECTLKPQKCSEQEEYNLPHKIKEEIDAQRLPELNSIPG